MGEFFEEHGEDGDVKSARPENKSLTSDPHTKTKVNMAPNTNEGPRNEPSHSGHREGKEAGK